MYALQKRRKDAAAVGVIGRKDGRWRKAEHIKKAHGVPRTAVDDCPNRYVMLLHDVSGTTYPVRQVIDAARLVPDPAA